MFTDGAPSTTKPFFTISVPSLSVIDNTLLPATEMLCSSSELYSIAVLDGSNSTLKPEICANLPVPPPDRCPVSGSIRETAFSIISWSTSGPRSWNTAILLENGSTFDTSCAVILPAAIDALIPPPLVTATVLLGSNSRPKPAPRSIAVALKPSAIRLPKFVSLDRISSLEPNKNTSDTPTCEVARSWTNSATGSTISSKNNGSSVTPSG